MSYSHLTRKEAIEAVTLAVHDPVAEYFHVTHHQAARLIKALEVLGILKFRDNPDNNAATPHNGD